MAISYSISGFYYVHQHLVPSDGKLPWRDYRVHNYLDNLISHCEYKCNTEWTRCPYSGHVVLLNCVNHPDHSKISLGCLSVHPCKLAKKCINSNTLTAGVFAGIEFLKSMITLV